MASSKAELLKRRFPAQKWISGSSGSRLIYF